jgi:hypothetical protein
MVCGLGHMAVFQDPDFGKRFRDRIKWIGVQFVRCGVFKHLRARLARDFKS